MNDTHSLNHSRNRRLVKKYNATNSLFPVRYDFPCPPCLTDAYHACMTRNKKLCLFVNLFLFHLRLFYYTYANLTSPKHPKHQDDALYKNLYVHDPVTLVSNCFIIYNCHRHSCNWYIKTTWEKARSIFREVFV